jgi:hypothetical protein
LSALVQKGEGLLFSLYWQNHHSLISL